MNMAQIAEVVEVHETTVSRAVSGKYMETPHGVFEMKYFFTTGYETESGESMSNRQVKQALADNAACVILAHNHPSGVCEPSQADIQITERLKKALALVDIRVLDHVIVGDDTLCFSERGLI